jgi:type VI secretion system protein ImpH
MEGQARHAGGLLTDSDREYIERRATRMKFFTLVSLLERVHANQVRLGGDGPPRSEGIRLRHDPSLGFPAGDVSKLEPCRRGAASEVTTTFLGLTGAASPLPAYFWESVLDDDDSQHRARRDFLDIFHHRAVSLLYRSVVRYSPSREHRSDGDDVWVDRALALAGLSYFEPKALTKGQLLRIVPLLVRRSRGAHALCQAIEGVLREDLGPDATVTVRECAGGWIPLAEDQQTALGARNHVLGQGMMLGGRAFDESGSFAIRIAPVERDALPLLLEGGRGLAKLREIVSLVLREPLDYEV